MDVVGVLTDSENPRDYWYKMKIREKEESQVELSTICRQLKLESSDGKKYLTDCANTEGIFRIIQSIPSPKAEPFKRWLAKVGYERIQELELIFSMLGEASTTKIARGRNAQGFDPNKQVAIEGGAVAGNARKELEQKSGEKVISQENYLKSPQNKKLLRK